MNVASIVATIQQSVTMRRSRLKSVALAVYAAVRMKSLRPIDIAFGMPGECSIKHRRKRIGRLLTNKELEVDSMVKVVWLKTGARRVHGYRVVAVDWTMEEGYWILMASVCLKRRAVPLFWRVHHAGQFDVSQTDFEDKFFEELIRLLGNRSQWVIVADRGFRRADLIARFQEKRIPFVVRMKDDVWVKAYGFAGPLRDWKFPYPTIKKSVNVQFRRREPATANLVRIWTEVNGQPALWYLATNLDESAEFIRKMYAIRMWIEEGFRDLKSELKLTKTRVEEPDRIARLLLIAALAVLILMSAGMRAIATGWARHNVPQARDEGTWSLLLTGYRYLQALPRRMSRMLGSLRALWEPIHAV